jgi:uncharacterized membrane protein YbhN (UPF0104 family)
MVAVGVIIGLQPLCNRLLAWWERRRGAEPVAIPRRGYLGGVGWLVVFWVWSAITFWVFLQAFPASQVEAAFPRVAGAYMVAWAIGFVTPFAPQGIGVTEAMLAGFLGAGDPVGIVTLVAGYRVLILIRDGIASLIGGGWKRAPVVAPPGSQPTG